MLFPPRHVMTEAQARSALKPHFDRLVECLLYGWSEWENLGRRNRAYRKDLSKSARARLVYDHVAARARANFAGVKGVHVSDRQGFITVTFGDAILLRFKKLDRSLRHRGIPTIQQQLFAEQLPLPGLPVMTNLVAGYVLDPLEQAIDRLVVTCSGGDQLYWSFDLPTSGAGGILPMPATGGGSPPVAPRVAAKGRRREGSAQEAQ